MEPDNRPHLNWTEKQALKDELFERAKHGKITGAEADAEAVLLGLGSLSQCPAPDAFLPEADAQWTLPMAVAWIAYLDLEEVRAWSAPYRAECWDWQWQRWRVGFDGPVHEGWHLEQRSSPTLALLGISASLDRAEGRPPHMTIREAQDALWIGLREDFFRATGVDSQTGRRIVIPPLDWHELVPVQGRGEVDEVRRGPLGSGYSDVLLPSAALQGYWRKPVESTATLPPTIRPEGDGYMPLYCAAQWIATEGDTIQFPPEDKARWRSAYDALLAAITSNKVRVVGMRSGVSDKIEGHVFAGIRVDYPFHDADFELRSGNELYLRSYAYLDDEHWRGGFDDALVWRVEDRWTRIMVERGDVRALWPFAANALIRSGMVGRPSSAHLVKQHLRERAANGLLLNTLAAESRHLSAWLEASHPKSPQAGEKQIRTTIRELYWQLKGRN
jgi:hypothetical protein